MRSWRWTLVLFAVAACGDNISLVQFDAEPTDGPPMDMPPDANPLDTLAGTGLCLDRACTMISPNVREYAPQFPFWDDEAAKRRWIYLPPGTKIDTTDMDYWRFPVGTKIWKEFSRDGTRVETRLILKRLADDNAGGAWFYAAYAWNATQDDTMAVPNGVKNAGGTQHDIPNRSDCINCHEKLVSSVLGFQAIQLDYNAPARLLDLDDLIAQDLLSNKPPGLTPHFPMPGIARDQIALGYLHGNCGHCHNPTSDLNMGKFEIDLRLRTGLLGSVAATPIYTSAVDQMAKRPYTENGMTLMTLIVPGEAANSAVIARMNSMIPLRFMPNTGVELVDPAGQTALVTWINSL